MLKKQTEIKIIYGVIGFVTIGLCFGCTGGYFLYYSLIHSKDLFVSILSEKEKLEISIKTGVFLFTLFGIIGALAALSDAPIVKEEREKRKKNN